MPEQALKNNYFEFSGKVKQQLSGTGIGTKYAPPYAFIFMDKVETGLIESQEHKPMVLFCYTFYLNSWRGASSAASRAILKPVNSDSQILKSKN